MSLFLFILLHHRSKRTSSRLLFIFFSDSCNDISTLLVWLTRDQGMIRVRSIAKRGSWSLFCKLAIIIIIWQNEEESVTSLEETSRERQISQFKCAIIRKREEDQRKKIALTSLLIYSQSVRKELMHSWTWEEQSSSFQNIFLRNDDSKTKATVCPYRQQESLIQTRTQHILQYHLFKSQCQDQREKKKRASS